MDPQTTQAKETNVSQCPEFIPYLYSAKIVSVYDGDTVRADIDLGFRTTIRNEPIRLARINTPEIRGDQRERGERARDALAARVTGEVVMLQTQKDQRGKYGRWIADIWHEQINVNDWLVLNGFAEYHTFGELP